MRIVSIVEGHGEGAAVPVLIRRIAAEVAPAVALEQPAPLRVHRNLVTKPGELERTVELAARQIGDQPGGVVVLLDADDDCPVELAAGLRTRAAAARSDVRCAVLVAQREYEAWFLASAESLRGRRGLPDDLEAPSEPELISNAKGWIQQHRIDGRSYSPTIDQPALTAVFDIQIARERSRSFAKFWRDVEYLLTAHR